MDVPIAWLLLLASSSSPATELAEALSELQRLPAEERFLYGEVPEAAAVLLQEAKRQVRRLAVDALDRQDPSAESSTAVRRGIVDRLRRQRVLVGDEDAARDGLGYGYIQDVRVEMPFAGTPLVALTVTFTITCGTDTMFVLLWHERDEWHPLFVEQAQQYDDIRGAHGGFDFEFSPLAPDGSFVVVTANVPQWCTSVWHPIRYAAHRIDPSEQTVVPLVNASVDWAAVSDGYDIRVTADGFSVAYATSDPESAGERIRETVTYEFVGNSARLVRTSQSRD